MSGVRALVWAIVLYGASSDSLSTASFCDRYCGGVLTDIGGVLESPGYDGATYDNNMRCCWTIQARQGFKVQATIEDMDIEPHSRCAFDYVQVFEGAATPNAPMALSDYLCGSTLPSQSQFTTNGTDLMIFLYTDTKTVSKGFRIAFQQLVDGPPRPEYDCGGTIQATHGDTGGCSFPNFPLPFLSFPDQPAQCLWKINGTSSDYIIRIEFDVFDMQTSDSCENDWVQVFDGSIADPSLSLSSKMCNGTTQSPMVFVSTGPEMAIFFQTTYGSFNPSLGFNMSCEAMFPTIECGGVIDTADAPTGFILSPGFPGDFPAWSTECQWHINTTVGMLVNIEINFLDLYGLKNCRRNSLQVYDADTNNDSLSLSVKICNAETDWPPSYKSTGPDMFIVFQTIGSSDVANGFNISYEVVDDTIECGGVINMTDPATPSLTYIWPPGYLTDDYIRGPAQCLWQIIAEPDDIIQISIDSVNLPESEWCESDSLQVFEGDEVDPTKAIVAKICNGYIPDMSFLTSKGAMTIYFETTSGFTHDQHGFQIEAQVVDSDPNFARPRLLFDRCGQTFTVDGDENARIPRGTSDAWYDPDQDCVTFLDAPENHVISLNFVTFDLDPSATCEDEFVALYEGDLFLEHNKITQLCGTDGLNRMFRSEGPSLMLHFRSNGNSPRTGYEAEFDFIPVCGGVLNDSTTLSGEIQSFNFPDSYINNLDCTWYLEAPEGSVVELEIAVYGIERSNDNCNKDWLDIFDGPETDPETRMFPRQCSDWIPTPNTFRSTSNQMTVHFHTDDANVYQGFNATYQFLDPAGLVPIDRQFHMFDGCGAVFRSPGTFTSSNYPENYNNDEECAWYLIAPEDHFISLVFEVFSFTTSTDCWADHVRIFDGDRFGENEITEQNLCDQLGRIAFVSTSPMMMVYFTSTPVVNQEGFSADFDFVENCGGVVDSSGRYISSPRYDGEYPVNQDCVWNIQAGADQFIEFKIDDLDIEPHIACAYDFLEVFDGPEIDADTSMFPGQCSIYVPTPNQFRSTSNQMTVYFHSDDATGGSGFSAWVDFYDNGAIRPILDKQRLMFDGCGGVITAGPGTVTSPNYPDDYNVDERCSWFLVGPEGSQVELTFTDFQMTTSEECNADHVRVFDGETWLVNELSPGRMCEYYNTTTFTSNSSSMMIYLYSTPTNTARGWTADFQFLT